MNRATLRLLGYGDILDKIEQGICPFCNRIVDTSRLNSEKSKSEFKDTGMCQSCFDTFGGDLLDDWEHKTFDEQTEIVLKIIDRRITILEGRHRGHSR